MKISYREFVDLVDKTDFSRDIGKSRSTKIFLLRRAGYESLKEKGKDKRVRLENCSTAKLTHTLRDNYNSAIRQIRACEEEIRSSDSYQNIISLLDTEESLEGDELEIVQERTGIVLDSASDEELRVLSKDFGKRLGGFYTERARA